MNKIKKTGFVITGVLLMAVFYLMTISTLSFVPVVNNWLVRWLSSEKYLLVTNSWTLTQNVFPNFGIVQILAIYGSAVVGMWVIAKRSLCFLKKIWPRTFIYQNHKEAILTGSAVVLVSVFAGIFLGLFDQTFKSELDLENLTPPSTWKQQNFADERGMNMIRSDYDWKDTFRHVNKQGYFSTSDYTKTLADSLRKSGKKIALVIGDSFVEGFTTGTWNRTFCELMKTDLQNNYAVFSLGIGGTDPLDYRLRVEKFVPELNPDRCIICFCGNNDIMTFDRIATPYVPVCWAITKTFFYSNLYNQVILPTPDSAYSYLHKNACSNRAQNKAVKWLCHKSCLAAMLFDYLYPWQPKLVGSGDTCEASYRNLQSINKTCKLNSVPLQIAFIPDKKNLQPSIAAYKNKYSEVFKDILQQVYFPLDFTTDDFGKKNDIHFNDEGNRKFADFLNGLLMQPVKFEETRN